MTLLGFARFYESINSMLPSDRPDDSVIDDDEELDRWYQGYIRDMAIKSGRKTDSSMEQFQANVPQFQPRE